MFSRQIKKETVIYWGTIFLVLGLLLLIPQLRLSKGMPPAFLEETYGSLNHAQHPTTLFDYVIHSIVASTYANYLLTFLPLLFALCSLLLLFSHVRYEEDAPSLSFLTGVLVALTPAFLAAHLSISLASLILVLVLASTYLYRNQSSFYLLFLGLLFAFDPLSGTILGLFLLWHTTKEESFDSGKFLLGALLLLITAYFISPFSVPFFQTPLFQTSGNSIFSFFGATFGYTLVLLILGFAGFALDFYRKEYDLFTWFALLITIIATVYAPLRLLGIIALSFYGSKAFLSLVEYTFTNKELGRYIVLLFICIFLFSSVTFIKIALVEQPNAEQLAALSWLATTPDPSTTILVYPKTREFTEYFSQHKTYDGSSLELLTLLRSRDFSFVASAFKEQRTAFVVVDTNIKSFLQKDEEGLLFLLNNNKDFSIVYTTPQITIYYFSGYNS